ncbi:MAG TPA: hypothetical protein VGE66_09835 [Chitinophagaceae bacterium]
MSRNRRGFLPIVILFVLLNAFFIVGRSLLERWGASQDVLIWGNLLLFALTMISFIVAQKGLKSTNPHAFVRSVYGSIMLKLFVSLIAAFVYIFLTRKELNKPAFFSLMGLYLVYTFLEVSTLTRMLKQRAHG